MQDERRRLTVQDIEEIDDIETLLRLKTENAVEIGKVRDALTRAQNERAETGIYADRDWYRRAEGARRVLGHLDQAIALRLSVLRKAEKERNRAEWEAGRGTLPPEALAEREKRKTLLAQSFEHEFVEVAREWFEPADFEDVKQETLRRLAERLQR